MDGRMEYRSHRYEPVHGWFYHLRLAVVYSALTLLS